MSEITIRRLGPADAPLMRQLNAVFEAAFEDPEHYGSAPPGTTTWRSGSARRM
jgi:aminoglycoside 3-N-acetyltransferase I